LDKDQRKQFDNTYYNHQEILKEFSELRSQIESLYGREQIMFDKIAKLETTFTDVLKKLIDLENLIKYKNTDLYETNRENQV
tara:strand:+ start:1234 stop:1479 length:246 start_codon:yes stop_codon:yes gene_type:complete